MEFFFNSYTLQEEGEKIIHTLHKKKKRIIHTLNKSVNKIIHVLSPQEEEKKKFKHSTRRQQQKWRKWMLSALMSCWGLTLPGIKTKWFKRKEKRPQFYHGLVLTQNATDDFGQLTICMSKTILPDICPPPWNKLNCGWQWLYWHWSVNSQWWMDHRHSNTLGLVKLST